MNTINIKALSEQVARIDGYTGRIPKDYSTTETATGLKWIDGKEIYFKVYVGITDESAGTTVIDTMNFNFVRSEFYIKASSGNWYMPGSGFFFLANDTNGNISIEFTNVNISRNYKCIIYYTKPTPTPVPGNREPDEEPETKKVTRKKSTK